MPNRTITEQRSTALELTELEWNAIVQNDTAYDGQWFYAVKSTGIFCRPSCKSRPPSRTNVNLYRTAEHAASAGYRPCKRCKPAGLRLPDEEWIESITHYIDLHYTEEITLERLSAFFHGSPYHLQRTFKRLKGLTPLAYIRQLRLQKAKALLAETQHSAAEVGRLAGMPNTSYFITWFKKMTAQTPAEYRQMQVTRKEPYND
ncbi:bifunctional transcriptional activator/DNA repair enzyme AdaA [Paenibacillus kobensis]|uniref:bifunctional transcriptional activator/DNA repair enzyme AdaA n=1 Tax=Paenibacillus kobensis TaxID=59841 RepID=UPI000FD960B7|nr:bifunctional transcriptional activator/DNA repair enzyme AdaA [Paenibacillus kobensis]